MVPIAPTDDELTIVAAFLAEQLADAKGPDLQRVLLSASMKLVSEDGASADIGPFIEDLRVALKRAASETPDPVRAENISRAMDLLAQQF
jgi:hypothetical protein